MIFGTIAGQMMTELIIKGSCKYQELYSPDRIGPLKSYKDFIKENTDVAKHFILDRFSYKNLDDTDKVAIGEGKLVKFEGQKIGLSRSYSNELIAIDPVCKHAGCLVKWNGAEQTWDCPCHGARYAPNGTVITGPSTENLTQVQLNEQEDKQ